MYISHNMADGTVPDQSLEWMASELACAVGNVIFEENAHDSAFSLARCEAATATAPATATCTPVPVPVRLAVLKSSAELETAWNDSATRTHSHIHSHSHSHHDTRVRAPSHVAGKSRPSYKCAFCTKCFVTPSKKKRHELTHTGSRPYSCTSCDQKFTQKCGVKVHSQLHAKELAEQAARWGQALGPATTVNGYRVHELLANAKRAAHRRHHGSSSPGTDC